MFENLKVFHLFKINMNRNKTRSNHASFIEIGFDGFAIVNKISHFFLNKRSKIV